MTHRSVAAALAFALGLPCGARAQAGTPTPAPVIRVAGAVEVLGLPAPAQVGRYARGAHRDWPDPALGVSYVYADVADSGRVRLNAYFYERVPEARGLPAAEALARQVATFREALDLERARGVLDAYTVAAEGADTVPVPVPGGAAQAVPGYWLAVPIRSRGRVYLSYFALYAVGNGYVKVRGTVPAEGWEARGILEFARELVRRALGGA